MSSPAQRISVPSPKQALSKPFGRGIFYPDSAQGTRNGLMAQSAGRMSCQKRYFSALLRSEFPSHVAKPY
ncbi:hypothetical protein CEXT_386411 [Caerostris extrusa]|uniref:Uncharacterized protein n=1 Tax=Caerostris extrusa TaxID=172846 RepID=A0AAV4W906_CAEEX|nr:hypothetical protein CEXT_386411 [Caerostris extrusa]